ncbi:hypothetical protein L226DRAFT_78329 [Lentinus tigrinus ALCF2SS1-7]|uniref:uncharacterized protein n=1 Tax=Lentinus tigrinus ALCF2SS1-7 TaxID=1328758 RepID=UPI00116621CC|nr:hypothetical protein L226DRAFT_78329 [Lentinus tigrinus ALCF2SS1-7]
MSQAPSQQSPKIVLPRHVHLRPLVAVLANGDPHYPATPGSSEAADDNPNPITSPDELGAHHPAKPDSQSSADTNAPAWTALATTSDEEDGLLSDSQATTPEPDDKPSASDGRPRPNATRIRQSPLKVAARGAFNPTKPFAVVNSHNDDTPTTLSKLSNNMPLLWLPPPKPSSVGAASHTPSKRKPSQTSPDASGKPHSKRPKHAPSRTTIRIPPMKPSPNTSAYPSIKLVYSKLGPGSKGQPAHSNATATRNNGDSTSVAVHPASFPVEAEEDGEKTPSRVMQRVDSNTPARLGPPKQPVTMGDANFVEGKEVDDALDTHVSAIRILPQYAQSPKGNKSDIIRLHVALRALQHGGVDKGKRRAHSPWTVPRWSKAGEFKERLDSFYGPGDINRGLGKGPVNVSVALMFATAV